MPVSNGYPRVVMCWTSSTASCAPLLSRNPYQRGKEVRLKDRFRDELKSRLHDPIGPGHNPQRRSFPAGDGDHRLPYRHRADKGCLLIGCPASCGRGTCSVLADADARV